MKKFFMFAAFAAMTTAAMAWKFPMPEKGQTVEMTFYGSKSSNEPQNPCKGATTRVCGKIVVSNKDGMVSQTNYAPNGDMLYRVEMPEKEWIRQHPDKGDDGRTTGTSKPVGGNDGKGNGGDN